MSGPRFIGWHHKQGAGQRGEEMYRPEAAKLLGAVVKEAGRRGLQTYQMRRRLADGTIIIAEIIGGIPRTTIIAGSDKYRAPRRIKTQLIAIPFLGENAGPAFIWRIKLGTYEIHDDRRIVELSHEAKVEPIENLSGSQFANMYDVATAYRAQWANRFREPIDAFWITTGRGYIGDIDGIWGLNAKSLAVFGGLNTPEDGMSVLYEPENLVLNPSRGHVYATHSANGDITVHDAKTLAYLGRFDGAPLPTPTQFVDANLGYLPKIHPSGKWVYVPLSGGANLNSYGDQGVAIVDADTFQVVDHFVVDTGHVGQSDQPFRMTPELEPSFDGETFYVFTGHLIGPPGARDGYVAQVRSYRYAWDGAAEKPTHTPLTSQVISPWSGGHVDPKQRAAYGSYDAPDGLADPRAIRRPLDNLASFTHLDPTSGRRSTYTDQHFSPDGRYHYALSIGFSGDPLNYLLVTDVATGDLVQQVVIPDGPLGFQPGKWAMIALADTPEIRSI